MEEMKVGAVFWDMDGTLIDTEELHYVVIRDWCAQHGMTLTQEENAKLMGKTMPEKWSILHPILGDVSTEDEFRAECQESYISKLKPEMALERSVNVVKKLHEMGVKQACVSNGEAAVVRANINLLGLSEIFSFIISGEDVEKGKPAPDPYIAAAKRAGLPPRQCIAVEDSPVGIRAAIESGCVVCAWPHDPATKTGADFQLHTGEEFPYHLLA